MLQWPCVQRCIITSPARISSLSRLQQVLRPLWPWAGREQKKKKAKCQRPGDGINEMSMSIFRRTSRPLHQQRSGSRGRMRSLYECHLVTCQSRRCCGVVVEMSPLLYSKLWFVATHLFAMTYNMLPYICIVLHGVYGVRTRVWRQHLVPYSFGQLVITQSRDIIFYRLLVSSEHAVCYVLTSLILSQLTMHCRNHQVTGKVNMGLHRLERLAYKKSPIHWEAQLKSLSGSV